MRFELQCSNTGKLSDSHPNGTARPSGLVLGASVVAFGLNYWLLERMEPSAMLMVGVAEVPIAVAVGAALLGERLPPATLTGAVFVLAGIALGLTRAAETTP